MRNRRLVRLMYLPPLAQCGAIGVLLWGRQPDAMYAQFAAAFVTLIVYGALGIQRVRVLQRHYNEIKRRRDAHAVAFSRFVAAHLPPTVRR